MIVDATRAAGRAGFVVTKEVVVSGAWRGEWLGDLDSNQGCPGQSREFYR